MNSRSLFRCLGDAARLDIVEALADEGELCVSDLTEHAGKERSNVSHHLAELRSCGLVVGEKRGRQVFYRLAHPDLAELVEEAQALAEHIACTDPEACLAQGCSA